MLCPIMSYPKVIPSKNGMELFDVVPCQEDKCAWWCGDRCAAMAVAACLDSIALSGGDGR